METRRKRLAASVETAVDVMDMADEDVHALRYVPLSFRSDLDLMHDVVRRHPAALYYAAENVKRNRPIVMAGLRRNGRILAFASEDIQTEKRLVLHAISMARGFNTGLSLNNVHVSLKDDDEVVRAAVSAHAFNYGFTSDRWRDDMDLTLSAVRRDGSQLYFASDRLRGHWNVVAAACEGQNAENFKYAHPDVRHDRRRVLQYVKMKLVENPLEWIDDCYLTDEDIVCAAVRRGWRRLSHLRTFLATTTRVWLGSVRRRSLTFAWRSHRAWP